MTLVRKPLLAFFLVLAVATSFARAEEPEAKSASSKKKVTILYTTDIHGHYQPHVSVPRSKDEDKVPQARHTGGFAGIGAKVAKIRSEVKDPLFLFDSGDVMTGHPICDLECQGALGGALFWMMNAIGYDAWCIGNHDFDHGRENAQKLLELAKFPTLSANLVMEGEPALKIERWKIIEKQGVKVGVFGLMTESLLQVVVKDRVKGITVKSSVEAARDAVAALTSKCDVIVALSHMGSDEDVRLADQVAGIDVILSGHNHQPLKAKRHGHGTIVTEGYIKAARLSRLDLTLDGGKVVDFDQKSFQCDVEEPTGELKAALDFVQEKLGKRLDEVLGKLDRTLKRNYHGEASIGDFFADGLRDHCKCDVSFLNSGGIRTEIKEGDVTVGHVNEVFPFDNHVVTFELTGKDLLKALQKNAQASAGQEYGVLQVSGVRYTWKREGKKAVVTKAEINGGPIDPEKTYKCAAIDFIAVDQHEKYLGPEVTVSKVEHLDVTMTKVAEDWVRAQGKKGTIKAESDGRMREER